MHIRVAGDYCRPSLIESCWEDMDTELPMRQLVDEPPPFLGQWKRVYAVVLVYIFVLIVVLFAITEYFHY